jgi:hypothetical protein
VDSRAPQVRETSYYQEDAGGAVHARALVLCRALRETLLTSAPPPVEPSHPASALFRFGIQVGYSYSMLTGVCVCVCV